MNAAGEFLLNTLEQTLRAVAFNSNEIVGCLPSKLLATFSATGKSTDVYHTTFPSFSAAAIRPGVIAVAGTASASETRGANEAIASAADPSKNLLRGSWLCIFNLQFRIYGEVEDMEVF